MAIVASPACVALAASSACVSILGYPDAVYCTCMLLRIVSSVLWKT